MCVLEREKVCVCVCENIAVPGINKSIHKIHPQTLTRFVVTLQIQQIIIRVEG